MSTPQITTKFSTMTKNPKQTQSRQENGKTRAAANRPTNDLKKRTTAQVNHERSIDQSRSQLFDSLNPDDPNAIPFSSSSVPWIPLPTVLNRQQWNPSTTAPFINTLETIEAHSTILSQNVQFILIGHIEVEMCNTYHHLLHHLLEFILETSGLKQHVESSTLMKATQNPAVLFSNLTPSSKYGYIKIPVKPNSINTANLYSTVTSTAADRFGTYTSNKQDSDGKYRTVANKASYGLSNARITHSLALMPYDIDPQFKTFLVGRNFTDSLFNFVCMRMQHRMLALNSGTKFAVLNYIHENEFKPDDPNRKDPLKSMEPSFLIVVPWSTTIDEMKALRVQFIEVHEQDFLWEHMHR